MFKIFKLYLKFKLLSELKDRIRYLETGKHESSQALENYKKLKFDECDFRLKHHNDLMISGSAAEWREKHFKIEELELVIKIIEKL